MITYINEENSSKYQNTIFQEATDILKVDRGPYDNDGDEQFGDEFKITSLNQYFGYLTAILESVDNIYNNTYGLPENGTATGRYYINPEAENKIAKISIKNPADKKMNLVRLPLDEAVLAINADTRIITIPSSFARYGVGVQGDNTAEILYFTIDRFFDNVDLGNNNINIAIQWEITDPITKQTETHVSKNFGRELTVDENDRNIVIFGWVLTDDITKYNGKVKFAVHFYQLDGDKFVYNLTTLPAELTINSTLNTNASEIENEINVGDSILNRLKNLKGVYDEKLPTPKKPILKSFTYNAQDNILTVQGEPSDIGAITYNWNMYAYNPNYTDPDDTFISAKSSLKENTTQNTYQPTTAGIYTVDVIASLLPNSEITQMDRSAGQRIPGPIKPIIDTTSLDLNKVTNADSITLKVTATANENDSLEYLWKDNNGTLIEKTDTNTMSMTVNVLPVAQLPTDSNWAGRNGDGAFNQEHTKIIQEGNNVNIYVTDTLKEFASTNPNQDPGKWIALDIDTKTDDITQLTWDNQPIGENDVADAASVGLGVGHIIFWARAESLTTERVIPIGDTTLTFKVITTGLPAEASYGFNTTGNEMTIYNLPALYDNDTGILDIHYTVSAQTSRNNAKSLEIGLDNNSFYRITKEPAKPVVGRKITKKNGISYEIINDTNRLDEDHYTSANIKNGPVNLSFYVDTKKLGQSDKLHYIWMKMQTDERIDPDEKVIEFAELIDAISQWTDIDSSEDDEFKGYAVDLINNISQIDFDQIMNNTQSSNENSNKLTVNESGFYYCIIVNELNKHYNANISPIFSVVSQ